jgi:conjugal transfer pilus assembly protein TraA|tara:strand:+ start:6739 stop:7062 length:324 start_codon:yes stop_codon:yes gene_type:complete
MNIKIPSVLPNKAAQFSAAAPALGLLTVMAGATALAGTDTTFSAAATNVTGWLEGSLGQTIAIVSLAGGVLVSAIQFRWQVLAASVGVALTAALGPGIVSGMVTATI